MTGPSSTYSTSSGPSASHHPDCIFCKIVAGQIPARRVHEDAQVIAFHDIHPSAPVHILLVPKLHLVSMMEVHAEHQALLGHMMVLSAGLMRDLGVTGGYRHVLNTGKDGGQEVQHLHLHVMGGPRPWVKG